MAAAGAKIHFIEGRTWLGELQKLELAMMEVEIRTAVMNAIINERDQFGVQRLKVELKGPAKKCWVMFYRRQKKPDNVHLLVASPKEFTDKENAYWAGVASLWEK